MMRALLTMLSGGIIAAVAVAWLVGGRDSANAGLSWAADPVSAAEDRARLTSALELLRPEAAAMADPVDLALEMERLSREPPSLQRDLSLEGLVMRLAEMDTAHALRVAQDLNLGRRFLVPLFRRWAELDPDAALAALATLENPGTVRAIAFELTDIVGRDARSIDRLVQLLPDGNRVNFELARLEHQVASDPAAALADAVAIDDAATRRSAMLRIAFEWGNRDPASAMTYLDLIRSRQDRGAFFNFVLTRWARLDPSAALRYAVTADEQDLAASFFAIQTIVNRTPGDVLAAADRFPPQMRVSIETFAARVLAEHDPAQAAAAAQAIPRGALRSSLEQAAARGLQAQRTAAPRAGTREVPR